MSRKFTYRCGESGIGRSRWQIGMILREHQPDIVQTYMGRATRLTHLDPGQRPIHVARLGGYYAVKGYRHAHAWVGNTQGICDYLIRNGLPAARIAHIAIRLIFQPPAHRNNSRTSGDGWLSPRMRSVWWPWPRLHPVQGFRGSSGRPPLLWNHASHGRCAGFIVGRWYPLERPPLRSYADQLGIDNKCVGVGCNWIPIPITTLPICSFASRHETLGQCDPGQPGAHNRAVLSTQTPEPCDSSAHGEDTWLVSTPTTASPGRLAFGCSGR